MASFRIFSDKSFLVVVLAFLIITISATYHLSESPAIWFDEGMYTQTALNFERYGIQSLQVAPGEFVSAGMVTGGFPFIAPIAFSYKLFGADVITGRAVMVIFILALALASYFLIRTLFSHSWGAWALLLLSSFAMLYGNGKSVLGEVPGLLFLILAARALLWLERGKYADIRAYAAAGVAIGLCVATKPIFILFLPALVLVWLLRFREIGFNIRGFISGLIGFLIPLGIWLYFQFGAGDTFSSLVSFYANPYGVQDLSALVISNLLRFGTDLTAFYTLALVLIWAAALFLRRNTERISASELALFFFSLIVITASLRLPGWNRYIFPAATVGLLFFPYSFTYLFGRIRVLLPFLGRALWLPYVLLTLMFIGQLYQVGFSSYVADYYRAHRTHDVKQALSSLGTSASIFVYNIPEVVILLPSANYYQFIKPYDDNDVGAVGGNKLPILSDGGAEYVIIGTEDVASGPDLSAYTLHMTANRYSIFKKQ